MTPAIHCGPMYDHFSNTNSRSQAMFLFKMFTHFRKTDEANQYILYVLIQLPKGKDIVNQSISLVERRRRLPYVNVTLPVRNVPGRIHRGYRELGILLDFDEIKRENSLSESRRLSDIVRLEVVEHSPAQKNIQAPAVTTTHRALFPGEPEEFPQNGVQAYPDVDAPPVRLPRRVFSRASISVRGADSNGEIIP